MAAALVLRGCFRWTAPSAALMSPAAVWVSSGRTGLLEGLALIIAIRNTLP